MKRLLPLLLLALAACTHRPEPGVVVESLYANLLSYPVGGAPDSGELRVLAPFLGDSLHALLARAERIRDSARAAAPTEKPPFTDGDLFTSLFEGPSSFYVMATQKGPPTKVLVHFEYRDQNRSTIWVDTAVVAWTGGAWRVQDVNFGGTWDFAPHGTLLQRLQ